MTYSSGFLNKRVTILNRTEAVVGKYGRDSGGAEYTSAGIAWASIDFVKGKRAMNDGAIDVYGIVMVRMRYNKEINMRSRIGYDGDFYDILPETFHSDKQANTIQFNAQLVINE